MAQLIQLIRKASVKFMTEIYGQKQFYCTDPRRV